nr:hypothetical protein BaRGS_027465 [Batillaria attramentaria]
MAVLMAMIMLGLGRFLHNPGRVQAQLETLGLRNLSDYRLEEYADVLKGSILNENGDGLYSRVIYDAVGLAMGRSFALPILLKVCDVRFLVEHVRTKETSEFSVTIGSSPEDRQLLMQTMYDQMVHGKLPELCQHPALHCPQFLQEFEAFCRERENYVERLTNATDAVHRMPLIYCLVKLHINASENSEKVHVVVPSKNWYLAFRLLTDKKVDERDGKGNTFLHVAAATGDLDAVKIAVKSGASVIARNCRGEMPPQVAIKKKSPGTVSADLQNACRDDMGIFVSKYAVFTSVCQVFVICLMIFLAAQIAVTPTQFSF